MSAPGSRKEVGKRAKNNEKAPECVIVDCENTATTGSQSCGDHVSVGEYKRLTKQREYAMVNHIARKTGLAEDLLVVLADSDLRSPISDLIEGLATLVEMSNANGSVPTDGGRRYRDHYAPMPSFNPTAANRELKAAANRIRGEYEKIAGVTRNPHRSPEALCEECAKRPRVTDVFCGPCAAGILREHRRGA